MYPTHDADALLMLAATLATKRRPAELVEVIAAFDLPENAGKGAIQLDGRMVELLHAEMARRTVALADAIRHLMTRRQIRKNPLHGQIASVSVGIYRGVPVLDLDYAEDSEAETDMNVVMNEAGAFVELQGTAEGHAFRMEELQAMLDLARGGIEQLLGKQREALGL